MARVLITAFEGYQEYENNASWLALMEVTRNRPEAPEITTRKYPVDFDVVKQRLADDLQANYDVALHLGQAPGSSRIRLESFGVNVGGGPGELPDEYHPLEENGPAAYRSDLPLAEWAALVRGAGIPAHVSHHAGTYLCNATLYLTHLYAQRNNLKTRATFIHLPLDISQTVHYQHDVASMPAALAGAAVLLILQAIEGRAW